MDKVKKFFVEFKSIFFTDDVLKENESHANIVTATTMLNLFIASIITYVLVYFKIFKLGTEIMNTIILREVFLLLIPAIITLIKKGQGKWNKVILFTCFTFMLAMTDAFLKYNVTLVMALPIVLSARYYDRHFTVRVAILTTITFAISAYMSVNIGQQDLNSYNLVIPEGSTLTVTSNLRDAITQLNINETERVKNVFIHFFIPKLFVYNIIAFACIQIAQSGKKMIEHQQEISKKSARIETELNLANGIQKNILPSIFPPFPEHKEMDIFASMTPAKEVAGDFYDMFLLDDSHLGMVIADVSGKGIPAALFMMIAKILIKNVSSVEKEVRQVFNRVNNMLCDGNKYGLFVTAWFGVLDLATGKLEFVNAGHNPPLLYTRKAGSFEFLKTKPNMVLAGMENTNYIKHEILLEPGDKLFLYTDGVVEATDVNNKMYGETQLVSFLNQHMDCSVTDTLKELKKDIERFVGKAEQFDDITMMEMYFKKRKTEKDYEFEKEFSADINELPRIQELLENALQEYGCDAKTIMQINLVVEEIFVNIADYAYPKDKGNCKLTIDFDGEKEIFIQLEDNGIPFNPLEKKDPDITLSAEKRKIGGLGIFLTKKLVDHMEYKYENNKNVLWMTKQFR